MLVFKSHVLISFGATLLGLQLDEDCPVLDTPLRQLSELFMTLRAIVVGIRRDGTLYFSVVQTMPFGRPPAAQLLSTITWIAENDYPARGELAVDA